MPLLIRMIIKSLAVGRDNFVLLFELKDARRRCVRINEKARNQ